MTNELRIQEVRGPRLWNTFLRLPWNLNRGRDLWVPPLLAEDRKTFDVRRNPAARKCESTFAVALRGADPVGRIVGIIHPRHNELTGQRAARFGWLETVPDQAVVNALLGHVERWALERGMRRVIGPMGFTEQDPEGFLVEGFEHEPTIATYYNHPYVNDLLVAAGYGKEIDYVVYRMEVAKAIHPRQREISARLQRSGMFQVVEFERWKDLEPYVRPILELMGETFRDLYGFVPPEPSEIQALVRTYRQVIDPRFVKVVRRGDDLAGFVIAMPNISPGLRRANGRLFPFGVFHILRAMKTSRQLDLLMGGIRADCRGRGVDTLLGIAMIETAQRLGFVLVDSHHEMEENRQIRAEMERRQGEVYKRFRIYQKVIGPAEA